jgi:hypothetical protein
MFVAHVNGRCMETYANIKLLFFLHVPISLKKISFNIVGFGMDLVMDPQFALLSAPYGENTRDDDKARACYHLLQLLKKRKKQRQAPALSSFGNE